MAANQILGTKVKHFIKYQGVTNHFGGSYMWAPCMWAIQTPHIWASGAWAICVSIVYVNVGGHYSLHLPKNTLQKHISSS